MYNVMKHCFLKIGTYMHIFSYFNISGVHRKISGIELLEHVSQR